MPEKIQSLLLLYIRKESMQNVNSLSDLKRNAAAALREAIKLFNDHLIPVQTSDGIYLPQPLFYLRARICNPFCRQPGLLAYGFGTPAIPSIGCFLCLSCLNHGSYYKTRLLLLAIHHPQTVHLSVNSVQMCKNTDCFHVFFVTFTSNA